MRPPRPVIGGPLVSRRTSGLTAFSQVACGISSISGESMPSRLVQYRQQALTRQNGRCCYCGLPAIPQAKLITFASTHGLSEVHAKALQCTAEHLQARCDGGRDEVENIAAACITCNARRHHMKPAPQPDRYRNIVQKQMAAGCWHKRSLASAVFAAKSANQR